MNLFGRADSDGATRGSESGVIQLDEVSFSYQGASSPVLERFHLEARSGEFLSILGPSGSGKTTVLRVIAGFERVEEGYVRVGGRLVGSSWVHLPPDRRRVGLVFQDFALFPHLTVAANVMFGLRTGSQKERRRRADRVIEMAGLHGLELRYPHELSGGQQQRVAVARALAPGPVALLLDEPFSNLDRDLRNALRRDVKSLVSEAGATTILVTHDREEALAMSDRVAVVGDGKIEQIDSPEILYRRPVSPLVARMVGPCELIPGRVVRGEVETEAGRLPYAAPSRADGAPTGRLPEGTSVQVLLRAGELEFAADQGGRGARVQYAEFRGDFTVCGVRLPSGTVVHIRLPSGQPHPPGGRVKLAVAPGKRVTAFPIDEA